MKTLKLTSDQADLLAETIADVIRGSLPPRFANATGTALIGAAQEYAESEILAMRKVALVDDPEEIDPDEIAADAAGEAEVVEQFIVLYRTLTEGDS